MDIPVINDFLVGYIEGARSVTPDVKVAIAYAGSFNDAAKGKELALAQYRAGTAIGFNVAGLTGLGQLAAAKEAALRARRQLRPGSHLQGVPIPRWPTRSRAPCSRRSTSPLLRAFDLFVEGKLPVGPVESIGLKEDAVGLVETGNMATLAYED